MKLTVLFMCVGLMQLSASIYSQNTKLTLEMQNKRVIDVLEEIEQQSEFRFAYSSEYIDMNRLVSVNVEQKTIDETLHQLFDEVMVTFFVNDRHILLYPQKMESETISSRQQNQVTGTVTDVNGNPLVGVSIIIKGTSIGTISDANGKFSLSNVSTDARLIFSFVGYNSQEITVGKQTSISVALIESVTELKDIVIIGYGTVKKSDLTGSIASLKAEDQYSGVLISVDQMIKGKIAGVRVNSVSSEPGGGVSIRIRGSNSITASNEPLYVIDGLPISNELAPASQLMSSQAQRNPLNALNPGDIESIEILKDASATAIYGSRGANGVILITTKKGSGNLKVDYSSYFGTQQVAKLLDVLNAEEYTTFMNDILSEQGEPPLATPDGFVTTGVGTDWQSEIFRKAKVVNHQLSFSGSSGNTNFYTSFNYLNQEGIVASSGIKQYTARINLNHSVQKFNFGLNLNTSLVKDDFVKNGNGVNAGSGIVLTALEMDPRMPVYDADGNYSKHNSLDFDNPVAIANTWFDDVETNRMFGNVFVEYNLFKNLNAKLNLGTDRQFARRDEYVTKNDTKLGQSFNGQAFVREQDRKSYLVEFTLNFDKEIMDIHHFTALAGYTYQQFDGLSLTASASDFPTDAYLTNNLTSGNPTNYNIASNKYKHQLLSYLGRVNYSLLDKYLLTASFRVDGSSRFGADNKFGYFPSVAFAWKLKEEPFLKNLKVISDLKLRTSYGVTGNQEIGNYQSQLLLSVAGQAVFNDNLFIGISPIQLGNPNLKWETTRQFDIGVDFGILNDRISGSFDYFVKNTNDLLLNLPISRTTGFTTSMQNVGDTKNTGFEFSITSRNLTGKLGWSTTLVGATSRNEVTYLGSLNQILQGGVRFVGDMTIIKEGLPLNSYYGYVVEGIFQTTDEIASSAQPTAKPGYLRFKDINGDSTITAADKTVLGDPFPDFTFGLDNTFTYKGFELNIFFEGMVGNDMLNAELINSETPVETKRSRMSHVLDRWTPDNTDSKNPSFASSIVTYAVNSRVIEDASYFRLKILRLSYAVPYKRIRSLSIFATAQNLFTITNYSGYDPDVNTFGQSEVKVDYSSYPLSRIFTFGLNVGF